jgi:hypothetical protein
LEGITFSEHGVITRRWAADREGQELHSILCAIAFGGLALLGVPTSAATFGFSFAITGQDFVGSGVFDGDLASDGDIILNMSNLSVTYTTGGADFTNTGNPLFGGGRWSLSGSSAEWATVDAVPGGMGISDQGDPRIEVFFGDPDIVTFRYDPGDFTIAAVPLPASLPLALVGVAAIGWLGRRKRA